MDDERDEASVAEAGAADHAASEAADADVGDVRPGDRDVVRSGYDSLGDAYDERRSPTAEERAVVDELLADLPDGARLLDAGCGQGRLVLERCEAVDAVGLDVSRGQVEGAAERVPATDLTQGDLAALPFVADGFDAATAFHSLIHVPREDHEAVVEELARVLRPGGELVLTEGDGEWAGTHDDWLGDGTAMTWDIVGMDATLDQLRDAGFAVLDRRRTHDELTEEESTWEIVRARLDAA